MQQRHPPRLGIAFTATLLLTFLGEPTVAQVRCTMPNGKVIEQKLADTCPAGATKGERFDGTPIAITLPPTPKPKASPQAPAEAPPPVAPEATAYDDAQAICAVLLGTNVATSCDIDANIFSASVIDATIPSGPLAARQACQQIKISMRKGGRPITKPSANWVLRFFSPYGSAERPIARCVL